MPPEDLAQQSIITLKGIGPSLAAKFAKLGVSSLQDLLFHLPLRYQDRTRITPIGALFPGQEAVIEGEVLTADVAFGRRRSLVCRLQDASGIITLRFYHFSAAQKQNFITGTRLRCFGESRRGASGLEMYHPEYRPVDHTGDEALDDRLTAVYPSTEGLSQLSWRKFIAQLFVQLPDSNASGIKEWLPAQCLAEQLKVSLMDALRYLHHPPPNARLDQLSEGKHPYQRRLAFEELLAHHLSLLQLRESVRSLQAPVLSPDPAANKQLLTALGFSLTRAQQRVWAEIATDLQKNNPMLRLLQGDVGSGKTAVAALAALQAISNGFQVAIMAPTEILAEQHLQAFQEWFEPLNISVDWLTGRIKGKKRQAVLEKLLSGQTRLLIGTHALFQDDIHYHQLALVIIDEQHRFGVHQRLALREKGVSQSSSTHQQGEQVPHQLIMTATPIPRTLAMSAYADLDISVIDELPPGRTPVNTVLIENSRRSQVVERVRNACQQGCQAYWVCTLIEESEVLQCQAAEACEQELSAALPELNIGLVHGRMKGAEKAEVMAAFHRAELDLLIATTVIEVGVNVPNASLMIIENPERLGLAQLHQLRGRVGRGSRASYCVLLYSSPLSMQGKERLSVMRETNDGFVIAEKDLQLRGPGEVLGSRQTGLIQFKIADLQRDADLLGAVHQAAETLFSQYPSHIEPLIQRWIPAREIYGNA